MVTKEQITSAKETLQQLEKEFKEQKIDKLKLSVDENNYLKISYKGNNLGFISSKGECHLLNSKTKVDARSEWLKDGAKVDESAIEWRGQYYSLYKDSFGSIDLYSTPDDLCSTTNLYNFIIYDFMGCRAYSNCLDTNLIKFEDNGKVVLF